MSDWMQNTGKRPPCDRAFVKLRCGIVPGEAWPVDTGRRETTRWAIDGSPFDIVEWRAG